MASHPYSTVDTIRFKRGDNWPDTFQYFGRSDLFLSTHGSGTLPLISNVRPFPKMTDPNQWEEIDGYWQFDSISTPARLFLDNAEVLRSNTLSTLGIPDNEGAFGTWFFADSTLYLDNINNPGEAFSTFEGSQGFYTFLVNGNGNTIDSLAFEGAAGASLWLDNHTSQGFSGLDISNSIFLLEGYEFSQLISAGNADIRIGTNSTFVGKGSNNISN